MIKKCRLFIGMQLSLTIISAYSYDVCAVNGLDYCEAHSQPITACGHTYYGKMPTIKANEIELCHSNYLTAANTSAKTPDWVAYHMYADQVPAPDYPRKEYFCPDPCLAPGTRAELSDYKGVFPLYNRGHMTPAGDNFWEPDSFKESFFLSNMVPQDPDNNGGIWYELEKDVDSWSKKYGDLYVIVGPVFDYQGAKHALMGANQVWAPAGLFKIIYNPHSHQVLSFMMPNKPLDPSKLSNYLVSVDDINKATGLDLLADLPSAVKAKKPVSLWP